MTRKLPSAIFSKSVIHAMNLEQFFAMGGYAFYVWTAYGVATVVLLANLILTFRRNAEVRKSIERLFKLERPRP